uniref:Uncharacterized protein n=1 Tax=Romanomermis culicivorax TaxID=13658 RepID=A0A915K7S4_ROMCU
RYLSSPDESLSDCLLKTLIDQLRKDNNLYVHNNTAYAANDSRFRHLREYLLNMYYYAGLGPTYKSQLTRLDLPVLLLKLTSDLTNLVDNQRCCGGNAGGSYNSEAQKLLNILTALLRVFNLSPITRNKTSKRITVSDNEEDVKLECSSSPGDVILERKAATPPLDLGVNCCSSSVETSPGDDDRSTSPPAPADVQSPDARRTAVRAILVDKSNGVRMDEEEGDDEDANSTIQRLRRLSMD